MNIHDRFFAYWNELEQHEGWIDLGMGMPPVNLFFPASEFHRDFIRGISHRADYQPQAGPLSLRQAIAEYETKRTGVEYTVENIMLVAGAIRGFSLVIDNLITPSSKLVEVAPTYPLLSGYARYAAEKFGCDISTITPQDTRNFTIQKDEILPYIHKSTILYITNPSNPTGIYMPAQTLMDVITACEASQSHVIIDESCDIPLAIRQFGNHKTHSSSLIRIQSLSKTLLLAGYRAGYIVADGKIIKCLSDHYAFSDANAPIVFNDALSSYLRAPETILRLTEISRAKVRKSIEALQSMLRVQHIIEPQACYYIFFKVDYHGGSWNLFHHLLKGGVNVVPGVLFGINERESWIRIGCGHDDNRLDEGLARLKHALDAI
jgi:aspartate aminotransferase